MPEWTPVTNVDLSAVEDAAEVVDDVSTALAQYLEAVATALRIIALFIFPDADIIKTILNLAIDTLEAMILDLLQNNVNLALHINLKWDREWVWDKGYSGPGGSDWKNDRDLPWTANGMDGWLLDVAASTFDESDPFRPLSDDDTGVTGFIFVTGVPSFDELTAIFRLLDAFTDFSDFKELGDDALLELAETVKGIERAREALFSKATLEALVNPALILRGEKVGNGYAGYIDTPGVDGTTSIVSFHDDSSLVDFLTQIPNTGGIPDGTFRLHINGQKHKATVREIVDSHEIIIDQGTLSPSADRYEWAIYYKDVEDAFSDAIGEWNFQEGTFPKWIGAPLARIFPPVHDLMERLRKIVDMLRTSLPNPLADLAELLAQKAEILAQLAIEIGDIIEALLALAQILEGGRIIVIQNNTGGMSTFIGDALRGQNKPDFGPNGIVGGIVGVATQDDVAGHMETFFQLVGVAWSDYVDDQTQRANQIDQTFDDAAAEFP